MMRRIVALLVVLGISGCAGLEEVTFVTKPSVSAEKEGVLIRFSVSVPTDVAVAVLDADGRVVRHLAAGMLGENAPAPLKKATLKQELLWDGKDDLGKPAGGGPFKVRVSIGSKPKLEKILGWDGNTLTGSIVGLAVGKQGEVYVLTTDGSGLAEVRVFDHQGKYLRTIMPYGANTPKERTASVGELEIEGERLPIVFNAHTGNLYPLTAGMVKQKIGWHPGGYLLLASAVGTWAEHGPPRHLLALHPEGGAPEAVGFVGPEIRKPKGFLGGAGERGAPWFDHLATSPDGEWIYLTQAGDSRAFKLRHGIFRLKWTDKELGEPFLGQDDPGDDDAHFNDPQGIDTDRKGNIYICDRNNNRVMIFSPEGALLGKFPVDAPEQIAVHPANGQIYIVSRHKEPKKRPTPETTLRKFSAWGKGEARQLGALAMNTIEVMALDSNASPPKLWIALYARGRPRELKPVVDKGSSFEVGDAVNNTRGLRYPMFIAGDPARNRVLVKEKGIRTQPILQIDLDSGEESTFLDRGTDLTLDRQGNVYVMDGYGTNTMSRYDPEGKPLPFAGIGSHIMPTGSYSGYGPDRGLRGHCVAPDGDIYLIRSNKWGYGEKGIGCRVDVFAADGKPKKKGFIDGLSPGDCGIGVDAVGNVYLGANVKPQDEPFPKAFMGKVPAHSWGFWRFGSYSYKVKREPPWWYPYYNPYLYHWGAVLKFGPEGGAFYGHSLPYRPKEGEKLPPASPLTSVDNAPPEAASYRSGGLKREIKVVGVLWRYPGVGIIPPYDGVVGFGDPQCICYTSRLVADEYGRVFAANCFRFAVEMLDTNANHILRIGEYGNADSAGPGSKVPEPEIPFGWPAFISFADGKLFVSDCMNGRVVVVRLEHAAQAECAVP